MAERLFVFDPPIVKTATAPWRSAWGEMPVQAGDEVIVLSIIGGDVYEIKCNGKVMAIFRSQLVECGILEPMPKSGNQKGEK